MPETALLVVTVVEAVVVAVVAVVIVWVGGLVDTFRGRRL